MFLHFGLFSFVPVPHFILNQFNSRLYSVLSPESPIFFLFFLPPLFLSLYPSFPFISQCTVPRRFSKLDESYELVCHKVQSGELARRAQKKRSHQDVSIRGIAFGGAVPGIKRRPIPKELGHRSSPLTLFPPPFLLA